MFQLDPSIAGRKRPYYRRCRVRASQKLLTIGQFCDPHGHFRWYQSIRI